MSDLATTDDVARRRPLETTHAKHHQRASGRPSRFLSESRPVGKHLRNLRRQLIDRRGVPLRPQPFIMDPPERLGCIVRRLHLELGLRFTPERMDPVHGLARAQP